jgi:hypothetical protein
MNRQQEVFYKQAQSDWRIYAMLRTIAPRVACHELHYLQMATEKFGKAHLWGSPDPPVRKHRAFTRSMQKVKESSDCWQRLGLTEKSHLRSWVDSIIPLVEQIERLAPNLADPGPNPEYPWPPDRPTTAPVEHSFPVWHELETGQGRKLIRLIQSLIDSFPAWA